jgi:hypothetical protein
MVPALSLRGMAIVAVLSLLILVTFAPVRRTMPSGRMFFLGAGFMLLETKGLVAMALLFGATWTVNAIVFFAILTMIFLANLYVLARRTDRLGLPFALLFLSLLVNSLVPTEWFLGLEGRARIVVSCAVTFLPIFFAGIIFARSFRSSARPGIDFGSNIAGVVLGALAENLSLWLGFRHLLWVAIGFYVLSAVFKPRLGTGSEYLSRDPG